MADQIGMLTLEDPIKGLRQYPTYTCAHCCNVVVMRPDRVRPRVSCLSCGRWICETTKACATDCTPLDELAADMFEASPKWLPKNNL